jgi:hypothetical protein
VSSAHEMMQASFDRALPRIEVYRAFTFSLCKSATDHVTALFVRLFVQSNKLTLARTLAIHKNNRCTTLNMHRRYVTLRYGTNTSLIYYHLLNSYAFSSIKSNPIHLLHQQTKPSGDTTLESTHQDSKTLSSNPNASVQS